MKGKWSEFQATTWAGHRISGQIHDVLDAGPLAGSLLIESVDGVPGRALLYGMPEIPYWDALPLDMAGALSVTATRKYDGTAIIFAPLVWQGQYLETICRTRGVPVLGNMRSPLATTAAEEAAYRLRYKQWEDMVRAVADLEAIAGLCRSQQAALVFELYGYGNRHTVDYSEELGLRLHTMRRGLSVLSYHELKGHAARWGLKLVEQVTPPGAPLALDAARLARQLHAWENDMEVANSPAEGAYREEGVVIAVNRARSARRYKAKPPAMREYFQNTGAVTPIGVRHELHKLVELGLPPDYPVALDFLHRAFPTIEAADEAVLAREYWAWLREAQVDLELLSMAAQRVGVAGPL